MKVVPFETALSVLESDGGTIYPFLESFAVEYSQKVNEDRKVPLFSKTNKYNSFPVRCHYSKEKPKKKKDTWRRDIPALTKIKKADELKATIVRVLNKITMENFESQSDELLKVLIDRKDPSSVKVVAELILEKVWYDKSFYELYVSLCNKLWSNIEWVQPSYKILKGKNKFFYSLLFEEGSKPTGPFKTQAEVEAIAQQRVNLKTVFLDLCRTHFNMREEYINILKDLEGNALYKAKRKVFGTVEIVGQFYKMGHLSKKIVNYILGSLLTKMKYDEEMEAFHLMWQVIKQKSIFEKYVQDLKREKEKKWCMRTKFMMDDIIEFVEGKRIIKSPKRKVVQEKSKEEIIEGLTKESRKIDISDKLPHEYLYDLTINIIKDSIEYGEFLEEHLNNLKRIMNKMSFEKLSEAFSTASENLSDFKIDAPKAPDNLSYLVGNLCKEFDDNLQICITPSFEVDKEELKFLEEDQRKEWENIEKLSKKYHSEIHINIFSL